MQHIMRVQPKKGVQIIPPPQNPLVGTLWVHALDDEAVLANLPSEDFEFNPSVLMSVREEAATSGADSGESKASADEQEASQPEDKRDSAP